MLATRIAPLPLEREAWAPFGWLPLRDTDARDGESRLTFQWSDVHANIICHRLDELDRTSTGVICDVMFCHHTHTQALLVLNCAAVIAVAPASCTWSSGKDLQQVRAFSLMPHDSLVLHQGTWHWGPFPVSEPQVDLFNVQGLRYAEDNTCVRLGEIGAAFEVVTGNEATGG